MRSILLAARNLGRNKRRTLVTAVTIAFGVFAIVFMQSFANALIRSIVETSIESKEGALQVFRAGYLGSDDPLKLTLSDDPALAAKLRTVPGVAAIAPRLRFDGMLSNGAEGTLFNAMAIDPAREYSVCPRRATYIAKGSRPLDGGSEDAVLIGTTLAESLGAQGGATLVMQAAGARAGVNAFDVTVQGLLRTTHPSESKRAVTVTLAFAQRLLRMKGAITHYVVGVRDLDRLDETAARISATLGPEYQVTTWRDIDSTNSRRAGMIRGLMFLITLVLVILVLTGVVNTMMMSVYERVREIGTMLAVGARRRRIRHLFLLEALILGFVSASAGTLLGCAVVSWLGRRGVTLAMGPNDPITYVPSVSFGFLVVVVLLAMAGALIAALLPAWRGSRLRPVEALRAA